MESLKEIIETLKNSEELFNQILKIIYVYQQLRKLFNNKKICKKSSKENKKRKKKNPSRR